MEWMAMDLIDMVQEQDKWRALVNMVIVPLGFMK
jgi:hypothetical protein